MFLRITLHTDQFSILSTLNTSLTLYMLSPVSLFIIYCIYHHYITLLSSLQHHTHISMSAFCFFVHFGTILFCLFRFGLKTAVPSAVSSSSRAVASPSPALPRRRPLQHRNQTPLIPFQTHLALTAPPLPSQVPVWPRAPALETLPCPSGARPSHLFQTLWPPRPPACSGPHLTP